MRKAVAAMLWSWHTSKTEYCPLLIKVYRKGPFPEREHMTVAEKRRLYSNNKVIVVEMPEAAGTYDLRIVPSVAWCRRHCHSFLCSILCLQNTSD